MVETLVATVLIVLVFVIASLTLNSIAIRQINQSQHEINQLIKKLQYQYKHGVISLPFATTYKDWDIELVKEEPRSKEYVIRAHHRQKALQIVKRRIDVHQE